MYDAEQKLRSVVCRVSLLQGLIRPGDRALYRASRWHCMPHQDNHYYME
jgi:hypothetical protein